MRYRLLTGLIEIYGVSVLFCFIAAFFVALAFTVIYPLVPIVLIIGSVFMVIFARVGFLAMRATQQRLARTALNKGRCPQCSASCDAHTVGESCVFKCSECKREFAHTGALYEAVESVDETTSTSTSMHQLGASMAATMETR